MADLTVQQKQIFDNYKKTHPQLSDEEILSALVNLGEIKLTEDQQTSLFFDTTEDNLNTESQFEHNTNNHVEANLQEKYNQRLNKVKSDLDAKVKENRFLRSAWHKIKNLIGFGASSQKVEKALENEREKISHIKNPEIFMELTGAEYTDENFEKFKNGEIKLKSEQALEAYKQGQDGVVDFLADMASGILAVGAYSIAITAAPVTGGLSIVAGFGVATLAGSAVKVGLKASANAISGKEYTSKDFKYDAMTGGVSGALGPFTGGIGGAVGKSLATRFGIQAVKAGAGSVVEQTLKTGVKSTLKKALINPAGYEYIGGNLAKRALAMSAEMATDGALGGALDGGFRAGLENDWDTTAMLNGTIEGGVGGAVIAPVVGSGFKIFGKGGHKLGEKLKPKLSGIGFSSLKARFDYLNFKKNHRFSQNNKYWKSVKDIDAPGHSILHDYHDANFMAFKRYGAKIEDEINRDFSYVGFYERENISNKAKDFLNKWNFGHIVQQKYLDNLTSEQARYVKTVLSARWVDDYDIVTALQRAQHIDSPARAYIEEQYFLNKSKFKELGWDNELYSVKEPCQAIFIMDCFRNSKKTKYLSRFQDCKTPEQTYLYSKLIDQDTKLWYEDIIAEVKTDEDFNIVSLMLSDKSIAEELGYYFEKIYKLRADSELNPYILKVFTNPKLIKNEDFMRTFCNALEDCKTNPEVKKMLNYILSKEQLQEPEFLKQNGYNLFHLEKQEKAEDKIAALNYVFAHKKLNVDSKVFSSCSDMLLRAKNKEELEAKMYVLDYIFSHKKLAKNEKVMTNLNRIMGWVGNKKEANMEIKYIANVLSDRNISKISEYMPWLLTIVNEYNKQGFSAIYKVIKEMEKDRNFQMYKNLGDDSHLSILEVLFGWPNEIPTKEEIKIYTDMAKVAIKNKDLAKNLNVLDNIDAKNKKKIFDIILNNYKYQIPENRVKDIISMLDNIDLDDYHSVVKRYGYSKVASFSDEEFKIAVLFNSLYNKSNINEISIYDKKKALRNIVFMNSELFGVGTEMVKDYPLLPKTADEYCNLLPTLVRSLGIETKYVNYEQIHKFNHSLSSLSKTLGSISDKEFATLSITQKYSKDLFISDVLRIVKDMPRSERQKVYDYFGFELYHNSNNHTGFSISGYPANLNNSTKLYQISDHQTRAIIEELRPYVVRFSEHNRVKCNNPQIEQLLNDVADVLPEIRTAIGKKQHGTQKFDIMQHSLKVLHKISKDSGFKKLNESDKKIMILAAILHDITKGEGYTDNTHATIGSFDSYYICKKLRLTEDESIKLYTLIRHHEWLEYVNTARTRDGKIDIQMLTTRLQSVAYDLQQDNLFDMALMFTHADLRSVKVDDSFHDVKVGAKGRTDVAGKPRSYGNLADDYANIISKYIGELQATQPLLPHTTTPKASQVRRAITRVNYDGSTNLRGIYVDKKDNLIIIKFNEATDKTWEAIGMPKGSSSQTAKVKVKMSKHGPKEIADVGNINFIVHGLDFENQMVNFDAFALKDSESLLSVSYTERPRDKYRFFRPQGLTLKTKTKYIHGGGQTDAGSGCKKTISDFKRHYVFGGYRESDRTFFSRLIKEATGMSDKEYVKFVQENADKPMSQIQPKSVRDKIIAIYAEINSKTRKNGNRSYNECYASNVEAAAPFAYPETGSVGNPVDFLNKDDVAKRTDFLRKYAHKNDEVFLVFGD